MHAPLRPLNTIVGEFAVPSLWNMCTLYTQYRFVGKTSAENNRIYGNTIALHLKTFQTIEFTMLLHKFYCKLSFIVRYFNNSITSK